MNAQERRINSHYLMEDVLKEITGQTVFKDTILCPFHLDTRQSAKIFHDKDGDRIYCFCLKAGSLVYTVSRGVVPIENVNTGDSVWSLGGKGFEECRVEKVFNSGVKNCYRVKAGSFVLEASEDHPVLIMTFRKESYKRIVVDLEWKEIRALKKNDLVVTFDVLDNGLDVEYSEDLCKILGFWLGDGDWSGGRYLKFAVKRDKEELYREYERIGLNVLPFKESLVFKRSSGCFYFRGVDLEKTRSMGFDGVCLTKKIPHWIWNASRGKKLAFIGGFAEADGSVEKDGRITLNFPQEVMAKDFMGLVDYLGLRRSALSVSFPKGKTKDGRDYNPWYRFYIADGREIGSDRRSKQSRINGIKKRKSEKGVDVRRLKNNREQPPKGVVPVKINSIKETGLFAVYNLTIEGNRNFISDGLVVHNTENKQYTVVDLLNAHKQDLNKWDPGGVVVITEEEKWDFSSLNGFKKGEFPFREFGIRLLNLRKVQSV